MLFPVFTIQNNRDGFNELFIKMYEVAEDASEIKVGLEATGHYSSTSYHNEELKSLSRYRFEFPHFFQSLYSSISFLISSASSLDSLFPPRNAVRKPGSDPSNVRSTK